MAVRVVERAMGETTETGEVQLLWERIAQTANDLDRRRGDEMMKIYGANHLEAPLF